MTRNKGQVPREPLRIPIDGEWLRHHASSGQAYFLIPDPRRGGKVRKYMGRFHDPRGNYSQKTIERALRWLAEYRAGGAVAVGLPDDEGGLSVAELVAAFLAERRSFASPSEFNHFECAFRPLLELYGATPARAFGPLRLKTVRETMIRSGRLNRKMVNNRVERIRMLFRWGVGNEMVPAQVIQALACVESIRRGRRPGLRESRKVTPTPDEHVDAVLAQVSPQIRDILQLMRVTGARCGEIRMIRPSDVDRSSEPWVYVPEDHKTAHHGHSRKIYIGQEGRAILQKWLLRPRDSRCFQPGEAEEARRAALSAARKTPLSCGNVPGSNRQERPRLGPGDVYTTGAVRRAIHRVCDKLVIPKWSPHQLRHGAATRFEREADYEVARLLLGHRSVSTTQIYVARDEAIAREAAERLG